MGRGRLLARSADSGFVATKGVSIFSSTAPAKLDLFSRLIRILYSFE